MPDHPILREATFDPAVKAYWMISTTIVCVVTIVGIPLLPIAWIIGTSLIGRYLERLSCSLTTRTLELRKGVINRTESTIPVEKITDLQMFQGPIMRHFGLHGFEVETAGQISPAGSPLSIVGIVDAQPSGGRCRSSGTAWPAVIRPVAVTCSSPEVHRPAGSRQPRQRRVRRGPP